WCCSPRTGCIARGGCSKATRSTRRSSAPQSSAWSWLRRSASCWAGRRWSRAATCWWPGRWRCCWCAAGVSGCAASPGGCGRAGELLVGTRAVSWGTLDALVQDQTSGLEVRLVPTLSRLALAAVETERIGSLTLLHPERRSINGADAGLKAALDMGLGLALLM